jgi:large subunit ribosomal protein L21
MTMSYAVIRTGGKQYRVSPGARLTIEKLVGDPGQLVEFPDVLLRGDGERIEVGAPTVEGATVRGVIVTQDRGPRILVFKKKRRKNYRRRRGHRQYETTVQITSVD